MNLKRRLSKLFLDSRLVRNRYSGEHLGICYKDCGEKRFIACVGEAWIKVVLLYSFELSDGNFEVCITTEEAFDSGVRDPVILTGILDHVPR